MYLVSLIFVFSGCSSGTTGQKGKKEDIEEGIKNGGYIRLNLHSQNTIVRGKNIFDAVMKKYQPVIDFYGADSEIFQKVVNTNLLLDAEKITSPKENMFNYDALKIWGDTEFTVEFEDGTTEILRASETLTTGGDMNSGSECFQNRKKINIIVVKAEKAGEYRKKITDFLKDKYEDLSKFSDKTEESDRMEDILADITYLNSKDQKTLFKIFSKTGKYAGYLSMAFDAVKMAGIPDFSPGESDIQNKILNMKLDHIIKLLGGVYTHLEFITNRLTEIQGTILSESNKQIHLDLVNIINTTKGKMDELNIASSLEAKIAIAQNLRTSINGFLQNYSDYSMTDYSNFVDYQNNYVKNDPNYLPLQITINAPHRRHYTMHTPNYDRIECILADFPMINPNSLLPFTYEGLDFLKKLYVTRFNINSFNEADEDNLNETNSNAALLYLKNDSAYIGKLRSKVNEAYIILDHELKKTRNNINGPSTNTFGDYTVKDNLSYLIALTYRTLEWPTSQSKPGPANFITPDKWNYIPWYSSNPFMINIFSSKCSLVTHDFPYLSSITFDTNATIEFKKFSNDVTFLDDANTTIDVYYKAKSQKLLEFAASLAALEIQIAMYLDDDDYESYVE